MRSVFSYAGLRHFCASLFPLLVLASVGQAAESLSLTDALRIAAERSRQLAAQDRAVYASREMAVASGQLPDPTRKAGIENLPVNGTDAFGLTKDFMTARLPCSAGMRNLATF